jgi:exopolysaccharide production protein ExoZ
MEEMIMKKINTFQSLRFLGAFSVFQYHLWVNYLGAQFEDPGTDVFLVLTGILAALIDIKYISSGQWGKYIKGRYIRLYITFIPVFVIYVLFGRDTLTAEYLLKSFFLIPLYNQLPLVGPSWMITLFLFFYWLFSFSILIKNEKALIYIFGAWGVGCLVYTLMNIKLSFYPEWFSMFFSVRNLEMIIAYGITKFVLSRQISINLSKWLLILGLIALICGFGFVNQADYRWLDTFRTIFYGFPLILISIGLVTLEQNNIPSIWVSLLSHPVLVLLGDASYVIFLIHNVIIRVWDTIFTVTYWSVPFISITVLLVSVIGYIFWEKPVLTWAQKNLLKT